MSDEWASLAESIELGGERISQIRIDWSTEQDAKTCGKQERTHSELWTKKQDLIDTVATVFKYLVFFFLVCDSFRVYNLYLCFL